MSYEPDDMGQYSVSFPRDFNYGPEDGEGDSGGATPEHKPRILLMGLRRSGKSSIQKVVFHKVSPNETLFLESTNKVVKEDVTNCSFVVFQIWDLPGHLDYFDSTFDSEHIFGGCGALIFVIDSQDDYMDALAKLHFTVSRAYKINPKIKFEVFIHKVDGLSDDHKIETQRDIHQRATDDLVDAGLENLHLSFYLTSIYDHSIFEAFSKVIQKLIPQLPTLENLLDIFISNSGIEKAFLFDVVSKVYIATDSSPVDMQSYELCCDMIDVVLDISMIYGEETATSELGGMSLLTASQPHANFSISPISFHSDESSSEDGDSSFPDRSKEESAFNTESSSVIKLNNGTVMYLREVTKYLALVCILREDSFKKQGLIDYNFWCFRQGIQEVFDLRKKHANGDIVPNGIPEPQKDVKAN
ncbi:ras-related GTP-binding protein C-like isoform X1 [Ruditapes philippinarum]|uniref:ras-related GTP-binding protein C-like isoform X1 n=1 Tax=Ruditapes philippinarum TaxID=129788 RepID=UPI00295B7B17|nr:ras-related GTP-binding protein C-like isoform X1 [Ruditapes philippinarum]